MIFKKFEIWKSINLLTNAEINYDNYSQFINDDEFEFPEDEREISDSDIAIYEEQYGEYFKLEKVKKEFDITEKIKLLLFTKAAYYSCPFYLIQSYESDFSNKILLPSDEILIKEFEEIYDKKQSDFNIQFDNWKTYKKQILTPKENDICVVINQKDVFNGVLFEDNTINPNSFYTDLKLGVANLSIGITLFQIA